MWVFWQYTQTESNRLRQYTVRLKGKSVRESLRKIWHVGFREGGNVGGPSRSHTGRHDPSTKTRPDKGEVGSRALDSTKGYVAHELQKALRPPELIATLWMSC